MSVVFTPDQSGDSALAVAMASGWWLIGGTLTFSGSYAAGGDTVDISKYIATGGQLRRVVALGNYRGFVAEYDKTNKKLKLWVVTATGVTAEHTAIAYDTDLTASPVDAVFLVKFG